MIETGLCGALGDVELVTLRPEQLEVVHNTYVQLARTGRASPEQHATLTRMAQTLCTHGGAEAIVFGGTDLTLLFNESNTEFPSVDCAAAHIDAVMRVTHSLTND